MSQYQFANNASTTLGANLTSSATTIVLATGTGSQFPSPSGGNFFTATLWAAGSTTGEPNEIVKVMSRTGDSLTVVRGQEGTTAQAWNIGDTVGNYPTAAYYNNTPSATDVQSLASSSGNDTGTANAGVLTLSPIPANLAALRLSPLRILKGGASNTGSFTLNVNSLGAVPVTYAGQPVAPNMLLANQVYEVVYDGTNFELLNPNFRGVFALDAFTAAGTYNPVVPAWSTTAEVQLVGAGGGGAGTGSGYSGGGGGAGGYAFGTVNVIPGATLTVVVGAGANGTSGSGGGGMGGATSIAGIGSANGGGNGLAQTPSSAGGPGGTSAGSGLVALTGGQGGDGNPLNAANPGGNGSPGPFGGQGRSGAGGGFAGHAMGAGGGGSYNASGSGGTGADGGVIIKFLP